MRGYLYDKVDILQSDISFSHLDCTLSGSTLCSVMIYKDRIYCINTGDSGAVIVTFENRWNLEKLSRCHRPSDHDEHKRIVACGGLVQKIIDNNGNEIGP